MMAEESILHITNVLVPGGAENHLAVLLPELRRQGCPVEIAYLRDGQNGSGGSGDAAGLPVHTVGLPAHSASLRSLSVAPRAVARLARLMKQRRYALVHTHLAKSDLYGALAAAWAGVPHRVLSVHNALPALSHPAVRLAYRAVARSADRVIAISQGVKDYLVEQGIVPGHKVDVVHYGLDPDALRARAAPDARDGLRRELGVEPEDYLIGTVGRLIEQKGQQYLIAAFAGALRQGVRAHLAIAGEGPLRGALEDLARELGVSPSVHLLGWRSDLPNLMSALDLFVFPSLWEGFGLVQLEAMAFGLPIVASYIRPLSEIVVDGRTGLLVPPRDVEGLARAMVDLYRDRERAGRLGRAGRERLEAHFTVSAMAAATARIYERVMGGS